MTKIKTKKVSGFNDKTLTNLAETAKIEGLPEKLIKMREDLNSGFSQDMVDEGIQKRIADGTIANLTINDASVTGDKIANEAISTSKLDKELNSVINVMKDNMSPANYRFKSHAYTTNKSSNVYTIDRSDDDIYTASVTYDSSVVHSYFRFKFSDKASEAALKDSMDFTVNSNKDVSVQIGLIFNGNWANGFYCNSGVLNLKSGIAKTHNIDFNDSKFQKGLTNNGDKMLEVALILKGQEISTNTSGEYVFTVNAKMNGVPTNPILYSVNSDKSNTSKHALVAETSNTAKTCEYANNSNSAINAGVVRLSLDNIMPKYTTGGKEEILSGKIPLINNGNNIEFNKTVDMVCDHYYGMFIKIDYDSIEDLNKTFTFNLKYMEDNKTKFNTCKIVKTKSDWYPDNKPIDITSHFNKGSVNLYEAIMGTSVKADYLALKTFYINMCYFNNTGESNYAGTATHFTIAPYFEGNGVVIANVITQELKESIIEEVKNGGSNEIVCWGDSLTAMGGWTNKLEALSGMKVVNAGVGGETSTTIMARQGSDCMMVNDITIPADTTEVQIANRTDKFKCFSGRHALPLLQGGGSTINPCSIKGVEGTLKWTGSAHNDMTGKWTFTRKIAGDAVVINRPTPIITNYMKNKRTPKLMIIFMGQNGGWDTDVTALVEQHKLVIDYANNPEYFILGLSSGTAAERAEYEKAMKNAFGRRFFSLREYLSQYGLEDLGLTPTPADTAAMAEGKVPPQLLIDSVHFSNACRTLIGELVYKRLVELTIL